MRSRATRAAAVSRWSQPEMAERLRAGGIYGFAALPLAAAAVALLSGAGAVEAAADDHPADGIAAEDGGEARGRTALRVQAGYGGFARIGRPFLLRIEVAADSLFTGSLQIISGRSEFAVTRPVEIPGGTTREFALVWEPDPYGGTEEVAVRLMSGSEVVATAAAEIVDEPNTELVGVFPGLADRGMPRRAPLLFDSGAALIFPVEPEVLSVGWASLEPLDIVVVTASDLRDLDGTGLDALMAWVNQGGHLLVDEPVGSEVPGVPAAWQPDGARPRMAGQGEIALTDGKGASGGWNAMFEPTPTGALAEEGAGRLFDRPSSGWRSRVLSSSLAEDANISLPSTGWMMLIVGTYIAIMGPGVWLALKALRRPELGWAAVPLVAFIFTAGIWAFGSSFRDKTTAAHATVIEVAPRGTTASVYSLLQSSSGRDSVPVPPGWYVAPAWTEDQQHAVDVVDGAGGSTASVALDTAGFAVIGSKGAYPELDDTIRVTARSAGRDRISVTVVNNLHVDLREAALFTSQGGQGIGAVPAGATREFELNAAISSESASPVLPEEFFNSPDWVMEPDFGFSFNFDDSQDRLASSGLLDELNYGWSLNARPGGQVGVAAWTDELAAPLNPSVKAGRTLLIARSAIEAGADSLDEAVVSRTIVRGPGEFEPDLMGFEHLPDPEGIMLRFVVPEDATGQKLALVVPPQAEGVQMWDGTEWLWVDLSPETGFVRPFPPEMSEEVVYSLPPEAFDSGRVYLRMMPARDGWGGFDFDSAWRGLAIRSIRSGDNLSALSYAFPEHKPAIRDFLEDPAVGDMGLGDIIDSIDFGALDMGDLNDLMDSIKDSIDDGSAGWSWEFEMGEDGNWIDALEMGDA